MKILSYLNNRLLLMTFAYSFLLILFEWIVFSKYRTYIIENYSLYGINLNSSKYYVVLVLGYIFCFILLWGFVYIFLISSKYLKIFYLIFFSLVYFYEFTYQELFGRFSTIQDLSLVFITTNTQSLDAISAYANLYALIPCVGLLILLFFAKNDEQISLKHSVLSFAVFAFVLIGFNFSMFVLAPKFYFFESFNNSFGAGNRTLLGYVFTKALQEETKREAVEKIITDGKPQNNIVLVLDESVRGDHLSINSYERETTPFLQELEKQNLLKNWGIAVSASTRSFESVQYILSGISFDAKVDFQKQSQQMPTLFQYAKALNYRTFYLDGQLNEFWSGNSGDLKYIDVFLSKKYFDPLNKNLWDTDFKIAEKLREVISTSKGNFIVVFKRGNHTPYNNNFPKDKAVWHPTSENFVHNVFDTDRQTFVNTYDNAIRYNLDGFFQRLLTAEKRIPNETVILYTSDHGQTLNENGEKYSHGGDTKPQANVPLFMISNLTYEIDTSYKASHANIFATLLDIMKFPAEKRKSDYAISLLKAKKSDSKDRYFLTPNAKPGNINISTKQKIKFD